ncbi:MAG: iron-containing alcohol dehydrogenase, partial [Chromatiales bacterium]|nr:iron-containing alcohol dehydrogenase [Chromatiales bacterium]
MSCVDMLSAAEWTFPVPITYGPGRRAEIGEQCARLGMVRPLIVTDRGSRSLPFIAQLVSAVAGAGGAADVFSDVSPNPTDRDVAAGKQQFLDGGHDGVIAAGGGSGMDAGKAISLVAGTQHELWAFDYDRGEWPTYAAGDFVSLITVPSTAGTGAETESTAMVTDTAARVKRCVWHPAHKPSVALLDPEITLGLPADLTAWTGCDALVHAIEAFSVPAWHPMCDGLALEAIRLIYPALPIAVKDGSNLSARGAMQVGACLAGVSFLKGLGLVHAMSHMIGAVLDTQHGLTNAILLPPVLKFNRAALGLKAGQMCVAMGLAGGEFDDLYAATTGLLDDLSIPDN